MVLFHYKVAFVCLCFFLQLEKSFCNIEDLSNTFLQWKIELGNIKINAPAKRKNSNSSDLLPDCKAFVYEFSKRASHFIECSIDNARPFRFCCGCAEHYMKAKTVYNDIVKNDGTLDNCKKLLLVSDRVQVINSVMSSIDKIWTDADCKQCFSSLSEDANATVHYTLKKEVEDFFDLYNNFTACVNLTENVLSVNKLKCSECHQNYTDMNTRFNNMLFADNKNQHVCMDIVDMMNYTRLTWGEILNCTVNHRQYVPAVVTIACLMMLPVAFYITAALHGTKRERNFMIPKRLFLGSQSNNYGSLDSPRYDTITEGRPSARPDVSRPSSSSSSVDSGHQNK
ncbi:osteopetrosis-associated transmembrane protein 1-like [Mya arenaria]|uniref:osteopetrosis-associated transmembrane protein 1-like n=1 Tax=Mya arenaria TaxID=6604 RepID=UPI0022DF5F4A|nr:osteopetrosis-associated transmembrane protein 1-like [Mya arenaria]